MKPVNKTEGYLLLLRKETKHPCSRGEARAAKNYKIRMRRARRRMLKKEELRA